MDGTTSLQEIATAYVLRYGEFDFDIIPNLIRKLQRAGLLTLEPKSRLRQTLALNRRQRVAKAVEAILTGLERVNLSSRRVQSGFQRLHRWGGFVLFTRAATVLCLALGVIGGVAAVALVQGLDDVFSGFGGHALGGVLVVKLLFFASVALHQLVHGLACVHYRRRVREFGFAFLHGFVPTFYVDVTDIFMATRGPGTAPLGVARSALARLRRALGGLDRGVSRLQRLDRRARGLLTLRLPRPAARPRSRRRSRERAGRRPPAARRAPRPGPRAAA